MKHNIRQSLWIILYPIMAIIIGTMLMSLVYCLPTKRMRGHVQEDVLEYVTEGERPVLIPGIISSTLDNYTDAIMLREAVYTDKESAFYNAMRNPYLSSDDVDRSVDKLNVAVQDVAEAEVHVNQYPRYWHGYLLFLKPLLLLFGPMELRFINAIVQLVLLSVTLLLLYRNMGATVALAFAVTVGFMNPIATAMAFQLSDIYYLTLLSVSVMLVLSQRRKLSIHSMNILCWGIGTATAFFDFLTYPVVPIGIVLVLYILLEAPSMWDGLKKIIQLGVAWAWGYGTMWAGKWLVASFVMRENILKDAMEQAEYRTVGSAAEELVQHADDGLFSGVIANCKVAFPTAMIALLVGWCVCVILLRMLKKGDNHLQWNVIGLLSLIALLPFGWYVVVRNHSLVHVWIEYRELSVTLFAFLCATLGKLKGKLNEKNTSVTH